MMTQLVPKHIQELQPYLPGKPIDETKREFGLKKVIKLASNENPLGPSPKAVAAIRKHLSELHLYPDASGYRLKQALSRHLKVEANSIVLGNGSNEVIQLLIRTLCVPGDQILISDAAFVAYQVNAQSHGVGILRSPLKADLTFDLGAMWSLLEKHPKVRMVFIPNPNNPTGTSVEKDELEDFLKKVYQTHGDTVLVVLDAAYQEFITRPEYLDPIEARKRYPNVVVLRTFSKVYGLAGIRVGYGVGPVELIKFVERIRDPFNLNALALVAAEAALKDTLFVKKTIALNNKGVIFWERGLEKAGIPFWKSDGNFILIDTGRGFGLEGVEVFQRCLKKGVIFRPVHNYGLKNCLRISVGTPEENKVALKVLLKAGGKSE